MKDSVFRSAISAKGDVDPGYLAMFWGLVVWSLCSFVTVAVGAWTGIHASDVQVASIIQSTGIALGAEAVAYSTMLGAVGLFRIGDSRHPQPPPTGS